MVDRVFESRLAGAYRWVFPDMGASFSVYDTVAWPMTPGCRLPRRPAAVADDVRPPGPVVVSGSRPRNPRFSNVPGPLLDSFWVYHTR